MSPSFLPLSLLAAEPLHHGPIKEFVHEYDHSRHDIRPAFVHKRPSERRLFAKRDQPLECGKLDQQLALCRLLQGSPTMDFG